MRWNDWLEIAREEDRRELRLLVGEIFSERLMIGLSLLLIPVLLLPLLFKVPHSVRDTLSLIDSAIMVVFIMEYAAKLAVAEDKAAFLLDRWHILDLFIISAPFIGVLAGLELSHGGLLRFLRLLRLTQVAAIGGRLGERRQSLNELADRTKEEKKGKLQLNVMQLGNSIEGKDENVWRNYSLPEFDRSAQRSPHWINISNISDDDIEELSIALGVSRYALAGSFDRRAYPQCESKGGKTFLFTKVPALEHDQSDKRMIYIIWKGILIIIDKSGIVTLARKEITSTVGIPQEIIDEGLQIQPASIIYVIIRDCLSTVEELVIDSEEESLAIQSLQPTRMPSRFLDGAFKMKREVAIITSWLLHQREVLSRIESGAVQIDGADEEEQGRFVALLHHCSYQYDASMGVLDNIDSTIDYYINATSFQMTLVMKFLAVMTALTLIPTVVGGLMGTNITGTPWDITLLQLVVLVAIVMLAASWTFYKLGWLK
jgi:Mg2+ and Co2+ transporter CorA